MLRPSAERDALIRLTEMVLTRDKWSSTARLHFRQLPVSVLASNLDNCGSELICQNSYWKIKGSKHHVGVSLDSWLLQPLPKIYMRLSCFLTIYEHMQILWFRLPEWYQQPWFGKGTLININEWMALKAATQLFTTYITITTATSQASKLASCDVTVCYTLVLSCGGAAKSVQFQMQSKWDFVIGVFVWICVSLSRSVHTSEAKKNMCIFHLWNVRLTTKALTSTMTVCS